MANPYGYSRPTEANLTDSINTFRRKVNQIGDDLGDKTRLDSGVDPRWGWVPSLHDDSDLVGAIIELDYRVREADSDLYLRTDGGDLFIVNGKKGNAIHMQLTWDSAANTVELDFPRHTVTLDAAGDIVLDADGGNIDFKDGGTARFEYGLGSANTIDVTGSLTETISSNHSVVITGNQTTDATGSITDSAGTSHSLVAGTTIAQTSGGTFTQTSGGNFTTNVTGDALLDASGTITLDADNSGNVILKDGGTEFGRVFKTGNNLLLKSAISDGDLKIQGNDGGVTITALTFDMSESGNADFNNNVDISNDLTVDRDAQVTRNLNVDGMTTLDSATLDGSLLVNDSAYVTGNLGVGGNVQIDGTLTVDGVVNFKAGSSGTVTLGDDNTDNLVLNADINSSVIPNTDDSFDLGSNSQQWRNLYINGTANIDSLIADTADINGGNIDGTAIGVSAPSTLNATTTTLDATTIDGPLDLNDSANISGNVVTGGTLVTGTALTTAASDHAAAINELDSDVGVIASMTTTNKSSVIAAINELNSRIIDVYDSAGTLLNPA